MRQEPIPTVPRHPAREVLVGLFYLLLYAALLRLALNFRDASGMIFWQPAAAVPIMAVLSLSAAAWPLLPLAGLLHAMWTLPDQGWMVWAASAAIDTAVNGGAAYLLLGFYRRNSYGQDRDVVLRFVLILAGYAAFWAAAMALFRLQIGAIPAEALDNAWLSGACGIMVGLLTWLPFLRLVVRRCEEAFRRDGLDGLEAVRPLAGVKPDYAATLVLTLAIMGGLQVWLPYAHGIWYLAVGLPVFWIASCYGYTATVTALAFLSTGYMAVAAATGYSWSLALNLITPWEAQGYMILICIGAVYIALTIEDLKRRKAQLEEMVAARTANLQHEIGERLKAEETLRALNANLETTVADRTRSLTEALKEATAADTAKTQFLANMSHELRTPLNAIIGFAQMQQAFAAMGVKFDKIADYAKDIEAAGHTLLEIVSSVLEHARFSAGRMPMHPEAIGLDELVNRSVQVQRGLAQQKQIVFHAEAAPGVKVWGDPRWLHSAVVNLVGNAIKFTPPGGSVDLRAGLRDGRAWIEVADNGPGIDPKELDTAFQPFQQIGNTFVKRDSGVGLGLALVKQIAERHEIELDVDTAPGRGFRIALRFPAARTIIGNGRGAQAAD